MLTMTTWLRREFEEGPRWQRGLWVLAGVMFGVALVAAVGVFVDPRLIGGQPAWLKPLKFGLSTGVYAVSVAPALRRLVHRPRLQWGAAWTTVWVMAIEVGCIALQAARGTTSHFNFSTPFDSAVVTVMGVAIVTQTVVMGVVAVALWRTPVDDAQGWALRLGLTVAVAGASLGGAMSAPTSRQLEAAAQGGAMPIIGSHTVGAPDGGPGLPLVGFSATHGDLRVAHFVGLHALQVLPLVAWVARRRSRSKERQVRLVKASAASLGAACLLLLLQALAQQSIVQPSTSALLGWATWLSGSAAAVAWAWHREQSEKGAVLS